MANTGAFYWKLLVEAGLMIPEEAEKWREYHFERLKGFRPKNDRDFRGLFELDERRRIFESVTLQEAHRRKYDETQDKST
jgi:hypothetical protein